MNIWLLQHIDNMNIDIDRFCCLRNVTKGSERNRAEKITKVLINQKILLQRIIKNDV